MFGVKVFAEELERVAARYHIEVRKSSEVTAVDPDARSVTITDNAEQTTEELPYDMLHVVPPQSAPDWIKASPISDPDDPGGYVQIDKNLHATQAFRQHLRLGRCRIIAELQDRRRHP